MLGSSSMTSSTAVLARRSLASSSTSAGVNPNTTPRKVVLVGAGFLASYIARALVADPRNRVVLVSRNPKPSKYSLIGFFLLGGTTLRPWLKS